MKKKTKKRKRRPRGLLVFFINLLVSITSFIPTLMFLFFISFIYFSFRGFNFLKKKKIKYQISNYPVFDFLFFLKDIGFCVHSFLSITSALTMNESLTVFYSYCYELIRRLYKKSATTGQYLCQVRLSDT